MGTPTTTPEGSSWTDQLDRARDGYYRVIGHVDLSRPILEDLVKVTTALDHIKTSVEHVRNDDGGANLTRMAVVTNPRHLEGSGIPPPEAIEEAFNKAGPGVTFRYTPVPTPEGAVKAATQFSEPTRATITPVNHRAVVITPWTRPR